MHFPATPLSLIFDPVRLAFLKRMLVAVLLVALLTGTSAQAFVDLVVEKPCAMMMTSSWNAHVADHDDGGSDNPGVPICSNSIGCIVNANLPGAPSVGWTRLEWSLVQYDTWSPVLAGCTVGPELDPPRFS